MGAWIETAGLNAKLADTSSHPSWVRGLKQTFLCPNLTILVSHPSWVRGLKPYDSGNKQSVDEVAPLVGAWIETRSIA